MVSMRFFFTFSSVAVAGTYSDTSYFAGGNLHPGDCTRVPSEVTHEWPPLCAGD